MLRTRLNQYRGVNAHMHSYAQHERDGWSNFHSTHITLMMLAIENILPPGYEVASERSLQIRDSDLEDGNVIIRKPQPDISIWDTGANPKSVSAATTHTSPTLTIPLVDTLPDLNAEEAMKAVVIRELSPTGGESKPVTRIELLSPGNKVGDGKLVYLAKRQLTMQTGTVLIEIDYLHETSSPVAGVPDYVQRQPRSFPYVITVSDPRPTFQEGVLKIYGVRVDQILPTLEIPLSGQESIQFDFDAVYQQTVFSSRYFYNRADYSQPPVAFDTYALEDQKRILARMAAIQKAYEQGLDLEKAVLPLPEESQ